MTRIVFDDWTLTPPTGELSRGNTRVRLQDQPLQVLLALLSHPGELVTREQLIAHLWPTGVVDFETSLNTAVRKVRVALGDDADRPRYIETIPRRGYRFMGSIASEPSEPVGQARDDGASPVSAAPESGSTVKPTEAVGLHGLRFTRRVRVALPSVLAISVAAAAILVGRGAVPSWTRETSVAPAKSRIAILPFVNLSPDPADAFFADGMQEEIISTLATRAVALEVVPRTTVMMYRTTPAPVARIAGDLGANYVMEGSLRRDGRSVRLTVQLVDGRSNRYLWSRNYDRQLGNALSLQSEVAGDVASQLEISLVPANTRSIAVTSDPEAYDAYLKARLFYRDGDWSAAAAMASKAIERDPSFAAAYITRSAAYSMEIVFNLDTTEARLQEQYRDLQKARQLLSEHDPMLLGAQAMYLAIADRDYPGSLAMFAAAETAGLKDPAALRTRAMTLVVMGRLSEAIALHQSLAALDPGNFVLLNNMAVLLSLAHRPDEAMPVSNLVIERFPGNPLAELTQARLLFAYTGRTDRWRIAYDKTGSAMPIDRRIMEEFDLLRYEGRFGELRRILGVERAPTVSAGTFNSLTLCCVGTRPLAEYRGWAALLANDVSAAKREGRKVLEHASSERTTRWNDWYLRLLQAEGLLMMGAHEEAVFTARASLGLLPRSKNAVNWRYAAAVAARVFAWGGAPEEAVATLEELDAARPGLCPAEIADDPLYRVPLEKQSRFQVLETRLAGEMKAGSWPRQ